MGVRNVGKTENVKTMETGAQTLHRIQNTMAETEMQTGSTAKAKAVLTARKEPLEKSDAENKIQHRSTPLVITVAVTKGGVAKTTTAVNLAAEMGLHGLRALLVDMDEQGNTTLSATGKIAKHSTMRRCLTRTVPLDFLDVPPITLSIQLRLKMWISFRAAVFR